MERFGMRQATIIEPELLIEALQIHDHSVAFPASDGAAVVEWIIRITVDLTNLRTTVGVNDSPVAIAAPEQNQDPIEVRILYKLESINILELAWTTRWFASQVHRIVL